MSHNHYKDLCNELKHDLKRKKRDFEEMEDKFKREETESKRLKSENHDLWKLYYGLQQELQSAYERNSKLQVEKMTVEGLYEREKHDAEKLRQEMSSNVSNSSTLKDALCSMQSEKLALQQKFNDLVVENKKLKDKEREVEPKLREVEEMQRRLAEFEKTVNELQTSLAQQKNDLKESMSRKDQIDSYRRLNTLLRQESEQKSNRMKQWPTLIRALQYMERRLIDLENKLKGKSEQMSTLRQQLETLEEGRTAVLETLRTFSSQCRSLNEDLQGMRNDIRRDLEVVRAEPWFIHNRPSSPSSTSATLPPEIETPLLEIMRRMTSNPSASVTATVSSSPQGENVTVDNNSPCDNNIPLSPATVNII